MLFGLLAVALIALVIVFLQVRGKGNQSGAYGYLYPGAQLSARVAGTKDGFSTGSVQVTATQKVELRWAGTNVDRCIGSWSSDKLALNGTVTLGPYTTKTAPTFNLDCTGPYGDAHDSLRVIVGSFGY